MSKEYVRLDNLIYSFNECERSNIIIKMKRLNWFQMIWYKYLMR